MANSKNPEWQPESHVDECVKSKRKDRLIALDLAITQGIADAEAGRLKPIGDVAIRLKVKYDGRS